LKRFEDLIGTSERHFSLASSKVDVLAVLVTATFEAMGPLSPQSVLGQVSDNYILPVVLVYPSVWVDKNTVPPAIEIRVLDQTQEDSVLDSAEGDGRAALDTESSTNYFEIPKDSVNAGEEIEVCISALVTEDYPDLSVQIRYGRRRICSHTRVFNRIVTSDFPAEMKL
jgi:hypothetical protein